ncbi:hypothetical protein BBJ28_00004516 [Nothophytophthora sp. Chile5]|nr:hypothetical protein BBJ28_00004516 [Nothophytophthora sp. Chile5]
MEKALSITQLFTMESNATRWLQSLVALLLTAGACSVLWELTAMHTYRSFLEAPREPSAEIFAFVAPPLVSDTPSWLETDEDEDLPTDVPSDELLHLSFLQDACQVENNTILPWTFGAPGNGVGLPNPDPRYSTKLVHRHDPRLLEQLRQCPEVDIYLPSSARGPGGCADVVGPLKFLQSRLLPHWAFEVRLLDAAMQRKVGYFDLCPRTPVLFLAPEHLLKLTNLPSWSVSKPVYLMAPGLSLSNSPQKTPTNLTRSVLGRTDVVLCRTERCDQDIKHFLLQLALKGDVDFTAKRPRVLYTGQATADPANFARRMLGEEVMPPNPADFAYVRFTHSTRDVSSSTTQEVLKCWNKHAKELGPLDVYVLKKSDDKKPHAGWRLYGRFPGGKKPKKSELDPLQFAKAIGQASFFVCPTANDECLEYARASGGVIITADAYPMNELIASPAEGVLFPTQQSLWTPPVNDTTYHSLVPEDALLLPPPSAAFAGSALCSAVMKAKASTTLTQRMAMSETTRRQFHEDTKLFALRMLELRAFTEYERELQQQKEQELKQKLRHG